MLSFISLDTPPTTFIPALAIEIGCHERTLWRDWKTRHKWGPVLTKFDMAEFKANVVDYLAQMGQIRRTLWIAYNRASSSNAEVGALGRLTENLDKEMKMRQALGQIPTAPTKLDVTGSFEIVIVDNVLNPKPDAPN